MDFKSLKEEYNNIYKEYCKEFWRIINEEKRSEFEAKNSPEILQLKDRLNKTFNEIIKISDEQKINFKLASIEIYKNDLLKKKEQQEIKQSNFSIYDFYKQEYQNQYNLKKDIPEPFKVLSTKNQIWINELLKIRLEYLELSLFEMGIEINKIRLSEYHDPTINFKENLERKFQFESKLREEKKNKNQTNINHSEPLRTNKSLLFNGKKLNLTERIKIANEILDFEGIIRRLNISDTEKYQLMAYILGNDVSNVRNVLNGTRPNKIREKEINEYLKVLIK